MPLLGQDIGTEPRRRAFLAYLNEIGEGAPCVPWPWAKSSEGAYTRISDEDGSRTSAHRWVWEQFNGPIPAGLEVCHTCDNPSCCRLSHLWLGTHSQNILDGYAKGRIHGNRTNHAKGERHPQVKLTEAQVLEIRRRHAAGEIQNRLAKEYGVTRTTLNRVVRRIIWKHLPEETI